MGVVKIKIFETRIGFCDMIDIGKFAFFIEMPYNHVSVDITVSDLVAQAKHFPRVVITGGEPLLQNKEIKDFIIKLKYYNPDIIIEINTDGTIKPLGGRILHEVLFNVWLKYKKDDIKYKDRIKKNIIPFFINMNSLAIIMIIRFF